MLGAKDHFLSGVNVDFKEAGFEEEAVSWFSFAFLIDDKHTVICWCPLLI